MAILSYSAMGTKLYVDSGLLEQVQDIVIDHSLQRLRARMLYNDDSEMQKRLRELKHGEAVDLALIVPNAPPLRWAATLRFCRTRIFYRHAVRITAEFSLVPL